MTKHSKQIESATHYFADARDYGKVIKAEEMFFRGLVEAQSQLPYNNSLQSTIYRITGFIQDPKGRELDVTVEFDVTDPHKGSAHKLFLGTRLSPPRQNSCAETTYFLCLADEELLLAKFHSDFDFDPSAKEKKPSPHVQIGGRIPLALRDKYSKCCWNTDVNKPRIPTFPICTALLWHWAFLEYQNNALMMKFLENRWWHKLIKDAEGAVLSPFFNDGARLMHYQPQKGLLNALYVPVPI